MKRFAAWTATAVVVAGAGSIRAANGVMCSQTVDLRYGWNAFYLTVSPEETAEEVFASWPVERVGWYDTAAFLATKQYSASGSTEGTQSSGYLVWRRGDDALSTLQRLAGNGVYTCFVTNAAYTADKPFTVGFHGAPVAPRVTWHPSSDTEAMNFVGFSLPAGVKVPYADYFDGLDASSAHASRKFYRFYGSDPSKVSLGGVTSADAFGNGEVVVVSSTTASDWSGVLNVEPMDGIDFGLYGQQARLAVRNDGTSARDVTLTFRESDAKPLAGLPAAVPEGLHFRNTAGAITNEPWRTVSAGLAVTRNLAAGETWELTFAIDRTTFAGATGTVYGVVAEFVDAGADRMRAAVPVSVTDGGAQGRGAWPQGLWIAAATLDTVTYVGEAATYGGRKTREVPSGGKMTVRLPVYVEDGGAAWLLQRYVYGYDTNGVMRIASGAVALDANAVPASGRRRVSSPFLPTDQPEIAFDSGAKFGEDATATFVVGETSKVNPMRHAQHPSHDGLTADYGGTAPSGDDLANYVGKVKPEAFSITNRIRFAWDATTGAAWNPEEELAGRLTWEFDGVRHGEGEQSGTLRASGRFVMKRVTGGTVEMEK